jgi:hypothetical protein
MLKEIGDNDDSMSLIGMIRCVICFLKISMKGDASTI